MSIITTFFNIFIDISQTNNNNTLPTSTPYILTDTMITTYANKNNSRISKSAIPIQLYLLKSKYYVDLLNNLILNNKQSISTTILNSYIQSGIDLYTLQYNIQNNSNFEYSYTYIISNMIQTQLLSLTTNLTSTDSSLNLTQYNIALFPLASINIKSSNSTITSLTNSDKHILCFIFYLAIY